MNKKRKHGSVNGPQEWELGKCIRFLREVRGKKEKVEMIGRVDGYEWRAGGIVLVRIYSGGHDFRIVRHMMSDIEVVDDGFLQDGNPQGLEQLFTDMGNLTERIAYHERKINAMEFGTKRTKKQDILDTMYVELLKLRERRSQVIKKSSAKDKKKYRKEARKIYRGMSDSMRKTLDSMDQTFNDGMDAGTRSGESDDEATA